MVENADLICNLVYDYYETRILLGGLPIWGELTGDSQDWREFSDGSTDRARCAFPAGKKRIY